MELFVSAPRGVESLLARELTELGVPGAVAKGAGVYVGPNETAAIRPQGEGSVKLFHLVVPEVADQA